MRGRPPHSSRPPRLWRTLAGAASTSRCLAPALVLGAVAFARARAPEGGAPSDVLATRVAQLVAPAGCAHACPADGGCDVARSLFSCGALARLPRCACIAASCCARPPPRAEGRLLSDIVATSTPYTSTRMGRFATPSVLVALVLVPVLLRAFADFPLAACSRVVRAVRRNPLVDALTYERLAVGSNVSGWQEAITWQQACRMRSMGPNMAAATAVFRLLAFHLLQPVGYAMALNASWRELTEPARVLGCVVGVREVVYAYATINAARVFPAWLLLDVAATWRREPASALLFVLSPEKAVIGLFMGAWVFDPGNGAHEFCCGCAGFGVSCIILPLLVPLDALAVAALGLALSSGLPPARLISTSALVASYVLSSLYVFLAAPYAAWLLWRMHATGEPLAGVAARAQHSSHGSRPVSPRDAEIEVVGLST